MSEPTLVELDERRRASFGKLGRPEHRRYLVTEEPDGTIVFTPAVVMTELEQRLLANPELVAEINDTSPIRKRQSPTGGAPNGDRDRLRRRRDIEGWVALRQPQNVGERRHRRRTLRQRPDAADQFVGTMSGG